jgi:hypothetical protein
MKRLLLVLALALPCTGQILVPVLAGAAASTFARSFNGTSSDHLTSGVKYLSGATNWTLAYWIRILNTSQAAGYIYESGNSSDQISQIYAYTKTLLAPGTVSGGTISGSGTCLMVTFNNGGTNVAVTATISGGVWTGATFVITDPGSGFTAAPTTATVASGTATCGGTVTLTSWTIASAVELYTTGNAGLTLRINSQIAIADTGWHHIAYRFDTTGGNIYDRFLDGVKFNISSGTSSTLGVIGAAGSAWGDAAAGGAPANIVLARFIVTTQVLSDATIAVLAGSCSTASGITSGSSVDYWPINGTSPEPESSPSTNTNLLTVTGTSVAGGPPCTAQ